MKQGNRWRPPLLFTLSVLGTSASLFGQCQSNGVDVQNPNCCTYQVATPGNNCVAIECVAGTAGSVGNWVCARMRRGVIMIARRSQWSGQQPKGRIQPSQAGCAQAHRQSPTSRISARP